jgi:tripartite-type tricarboxylate transporter receptor subunit TctC
MLGLSALGVAGHAQAQAYPSKPVRVIVPWPTGGNADTLARVLGSKLAEATGQSFVIDNRAGAGGNIGMELAAKSPADGYTIAEVISANAINVTLYPKLGFDLAKDFVAVGIAGELPLIVVIHPALPVKSLQELVAYAKANPGKVNYGSGGNGTAGHLAVELFKSMAGVQMTHIPYKGSVPALTDLLAGRVQVFFDGMPSSLPHVKTGALRVLAITTKKRFSGLPDVPTVAEAGIPGYEVSPWLGFMAPAGTDAQAIARLNLELNRALASTDVQERFARAGLIPVSGTPQEFGAFVHAEIAKWAGVIRSSGAKID